MTIRAPFKPHYGTGQNITPAAGALSISLNAVDKSVRIVNLGATNVMYFRIGTAAQIALQAATTADTALLQGDSIIVEKADGADTLSYISAVGTTAHVQTGEGGQ